MTADLRHCRTSPAALYSDLRTVWSADTASPANGWSPDVPARNHCSVTALVVQDAFGGQILTTRTSGGQHFYNMIDGVRWDLTVSQFEEPIGFQDVPATREEALGDTSAGKYGALIERLAAISDQRLENSSTRPMMEHASAKPPSS